MLNTIIHYWVQIALTSITSLIVYMFKEYISFKNGLKALLRIEIIRIYETYSILGYCPSYVKENIHEIYLNYHRLKGNGLASSIIEEIYKLPSKEVYGEKDS